jgi:hypothetical protein
MPNSDGPELRPLLGSFDDVFPPTPLPGSDVFPDTETRESDITSALGGERFLWVFSCSTASAVFTARDVR